MQRSSMVANILILLAGTTLLSGASDGGSQEAQLSVTATVIHPAQVSVLESSAESAVLLIGNTDSVQVNVVGGSATAVDHNKTIVRSDGAGPVGVTVRY